MAYNIKNKILTASQGKMNTKKQLNIKKASKKAVKPQININIFSLKISVAKDEKCNPECYFSLDWSKKYPLTNQEIRTIFSRQEVETVKLFLTPKPKIKKKKDFVISPKIFDPQNFQLLVTGFKLAMIWNIYVWIEN